MPICTALFLEIFMLGKQNAAMSHTEKAAIILFIGERNERQNNGNNNAPYLDIMQDASRGDFF